MIAFHGLILLRKDPKFKKILQKVLTGTENSPNSLNACLDKEFCKNLMLNYYMHQEVIDYLLEKKCYDEALQMYRDKAEDYIKHFQTGNNKKSLAETAVKAVLAKKIGNQQIDNPWLKKYLKILRITPSISEAQAIENSRSLAKTFKTDP